MSVASFRPEAHGGQVSLADTAYAAIRDQLVLLDIRPGDPINDGELARSLGVGRTPVREALKRLELDRLVYSYPRRGTFAARIDITDLAFICDIRVRLEPLAAAQAAERATAADRDRLTELIGEIEALAAGDTSGDAGGERAGGREGRELIRADMHVHRIIYAICGNPYLEDSLVRYDNLATRIWCQVLDRLPTVHEHVLEHIDLLRAVIDADADAAERTARAHVLDFEQAIRSVL